MNNSNLTRLTARHRRRSHSKDLRLSNDDLHIINRALEENRAMLAELRIEIREKVYFEGATLQDIQKHQSLFDKNEVFNLLGDRYPLQPQHIEEGADILAHWRAHPALADPLSLEQTIQLLADLLDLTTHIPCETLAVTA